ncbi:MAG: hypothetical protein D6693_06560 [Planctomycetota bacterium]|nr:MAG: hypothetical protein D6693_06560 [Planctomycetota bacterium]
MRFGFREAVFLVVLLAVPVASYWFVFRPQNAEIERARQEIAQKEAMLRKLAEVTAQREDLAALNTEIAEAIAMIEAKLPTAREVDVVLAQVAAIAEENRLSLAKVKSDDPVAMASYMEQPLKMVIRGDFEGFYQFLLDLENLDRITRMPTVDIERSRDADGDMSAEFTLSIYFEKGQEGADS